LANIQRDPAAAYGHLLKLNLVSSLETLSQYDGLLFGTVLPQLAHPGARKVTHAVS
jgi:hypothetical protein